MQTWIMFLRGINVSGKNIIPKKELLQLMENCSFSDVETYIQSGNIIFKSELDRQTIKIKAQKELFDFTGNDISVFLFSNAELTKILEESPYLKQENVTEKALYFTLFNENIPSINIEAEKYLPDEYQILEKVVHLNCIGGYGKTKLNNNFFEKKTKLSATTRNLKTMQQMQQRSF